MNEVFIQMMCTIRLSFLFDLRMGKLFDFEVYCLKAHRLEAIWPRAQKVIE